MFSSRGETMRIGLLTIGLAALLRAADQQRAEAQPAADEQPADALGPMKFVGGSINGVYIDFLKVYGIKRAKCHSR